MNTGEIRPFMETLATLREGACLDDLAFEINQVVAGVRLTGKTGDLTLKIKVAPFKQGNGDVVMLVDQITSKIPEPEKPGTLLFTTEDNNLQRDNPKQREMKLEPVADAPNRSLTSLVPGKP